TSEALASRPFVHVVEKFPAEAGRVGRRDCSNHTAAVDDLGEQAEARASEMPADVADQQRIAQVGLVGAVLQQRFLVGDTRELAGRSNGPPVGELLKYA